MKKVYYIRTSVEHGMFQDTTTKTELPGIEEWEFIEHFYPDYYRSDDILSNDILSKYVDHIEHNEEIEEEYLETFKERTIEDVKTELKESNDYLKTEAAKHFYKMLRFGTITIIYE